MWIINQKRNKVCYCTNIWIDSTSFSIRNNEEELAMYDSIEECQKVFEEVINSIKYKHEIYTMPKQEDKK